MYPVDEYHDKGRKAYRAGRPGTVAEAQIDLSSWLQLHPEQTGNTLTQAWLKGWKDAERTAPRK